MFKWFKNLNPATPGGMLKMTQEFGQMLDSGRHTFSTAFNALLGGTDPEVIRENLFATDRKINSSEQQIRREIAVHAAVHGPTNVAGRLTLMSIVKDAERIGDYAKNIFDLACIAPVPEDAPERADLIKLKDRVINGLAETRAVFDGQGEQQARELVRLLGELEDHCDEKVDDLLKVQAEHICPASLVLAYRYCKRVVSHSRNIATSTFMPLDKIDFFDEDPRPEL